MTPVDVERFADAMERITSTEEIPALRAELKRDDVTGDLAGITAPTLIWTERNADRTPGAQELTTLIGGAALVLIDDLYASAPVALAVEQLIGAPQSKASDAAVDGAFRAILFTDVVSSTPLLAQLKDAKMRDVMRDHDAVLQAAVDEHGGRVIKTIGDAFMAEFAVPSAAVECAIAMQRGIQAQFADSDVPIRLRIGINAGEPIAEDDDLHGISVNIAKRLESAAATNGIWVSDVVKAAVAGKDFEFADQGEVSLKGFEEPVRAWSVGWSE
jgi:class 3 adenylate cyclase